MLSKIFRINSGFRKFNLHSFLVHELHFDVGNLDSI